MASTAPRPGRDAGVAKLRGQENYNSWMTELIVALSVENLEGFIDGMVVPPVAGTPEFTEWMMNDRVAKHSIIASIPPEMRDLIVENGWKNHMTAKETMDLIKESSMDPEATFHSTYGER